MTNLNHAPTKGSPLGELSPKVTEGLNAIVNQHFLTPPSKIKDFCHLP